MESTDDSREPRGRPLRLSLGRHTAHTHLRRHEPKAELHGHLIRARRQARQRLCQVAELQARDRAEGQGGRTRQQEESGSHARRCRPLCRRERTGRRQVGQSEPDRRRHLPPHQQLTALADGIHQHGKHTRLWLWRTHAARDADRRRVGRPRGGAAAARGRRLPVLCQRTDEHRRGAARHQPLRTQCILFHHADRHAGSNYRHTRTTHSDADSRGLRLRRRGLPQPAGVRMVQRRTAALRELQLCQRQHTDIRHEAAHTRRHCRGHPDGGFLGRQQKRDGAVHHRQRPAADHGTHQPTGRLHLRHAHHTTLRHRRAAIQHDTALYDARQQRTPQLPRTGLQGADAH